jgi:hypothetical protein
VPTISRTNCFFLLSRLFFFLRASTGMLVLRLRSGSPKDPVGCVGQNSSRGARQTQRRPLRDSATRSFNYFLSCLRPIGVYLGDPLRHSGLRLMPLIRVNQWPTWGSNAFCWGIAWDRRSSVHSVCAAPSSIRHALQHDDLRLGRPTVSTLPLAKNGFFRRLQIDDKTTSASRRPE